MTIILGSVALSLSFACNGLLLTAEHQGSLSQIANIIVILAKGVQLLSKIKPISLKYFYVDNMLDQSLSKCFDSKSIFEHHQK